ncbi:MAG: hypothetical protein PHX51_04240 [Clostridia bacterium]|nr:hypothetical protein [Clostridia bacterium]
MTYHINMKVPYLFRNSYFILQSGLRRNRKSCFLICAFALIGMILGAIFSKKLCAIEWFTYKNAEWFCMVMATDGAVKLILRLFWSGLKALLIICVAGCVKQLFFVYYLTVLLRFMSMCVALAVLIAELGVVGVLYLTVFIVFQLLWLALVIVLYVLQNETHLCVGRISRELLMMNFKYLIAIAILLVAVSLVCGVLIIVIVSPLACFV